MRQIIVYTTSTGRDLPMFVDVEKVLTSQIITNKEATLGECAKCKMFGKGGGCPPIAPTFDVSYREKYQFGYIVVLTIPVDKWMPDKYREVSIGTRAFLMSNFVQIVMKPIETKMANILAPFAGVVFSAGYCGGCHKCNVKAGGHCIKPNERMFSMESTGILVDNTIQQIGLPPLDWFRYKVPHIPKYTCRVILLLTDKEVNPSNIIMRFGGIKGVTVL